ncbi:MAG: LacI family DNA-binding transcriptional regulator [Spirochaetales bacterium]|nr:LacI family DNA-binding transcriptional regulator [Spirochaetales bacterium]
MKSKPVTLHQIAEAAGISIGTVDRALNNRGRVAPATKERVLRAVQELGYTRNIIASSLSRNRPFRFSIIMPDSDGDAGYWNMPAAGIRTAAEELSHFNVRILIHHYSILSNNSFTECIKKVIKEKTDGLLIAPSGIINPDLLVDSIPRDLPCVFFDSIAAGVKPISSIGQDPVRSGELAARLMSLLASSRGKLLVLLPVTGPSHIRIRVERFSQAALNNGFSQVIPQTFNPTDSIDKLVGQGCSILSEHKPAGIFVTNSFTFIFAAARQQIFPDTHIPMIGYDLIQENIKYLSAGVIDFILSQRPFEQGYLGIMSLFRSIVLKESIRKSILLPIDIITKESVNNYIQHIPVFPHNTQTV